MPQPCHVLLVDDNPYFLEAAGCFLELQPALKVVGALASGGAAVTQAQQLTVDVILLDLNLGNESGLTYIAELRRVQPAAKIILLTLYEDEFSRAVARGAGADAFIYKADIPQRLMPLIQDVMQAAL